jgi:CTP synthase
VQFHPEFQSKPNQPHPLFAAFIAAAVKNKKGGAKEKASAKPASARKGAKKK